jgi:hypothetical protein
MFDIQNSLFDIKSPVIFRRLTAIASRLDRRRVGPAVRRYFGLLCLALIWQLHKLKHLIMSIFHSAPGVPRVKMERFAGV